MSTPPRTLVRRITVAAPLAEGTCRAPSKSVEAEGGVYVNSLYFLLNFTVNLRCFKEIKYSFFLFFQSVEVLQTLALLPTWLPGVYNAPGLGHPLRLNTSPHMLPSGLAPSTQTPQTLPQCMPPVVGRKMATKYVLIPQPSEYVVTYTGELRSQMKLRLQINDLNTELGLL